MATSSMLEFICRFGLLVMLSAGDGRTVHAQSVSYSAVWEICRLVEPYLSVISGLSMARKEGECEPQANWRLRKLLEVLRLKPGFSDLSEGSFKEDLI